MSGALDISLRAAAFDLSLRSYEALLNNRKDKIDAENLKSEFIIFLDDLARRYADLYVDLTDLLDAQKKSLDDGGQSGLVVSLEDIS